MRGHKITTLTRNFSEKLSLLVGLSSTDEVFRRNQPVRLPNQDAPSIYYHSIPVGAADVTDNSIRRGFDTVSTGDNELHQMRIDRVE